MTSTSQSHISSERYRFPLRHCLIVLSNCAFPWVNHHRRARSRTTCHSTGLSRTSDHHQKPGLVCLRRSINSINRLCKLTSSRANSEELWPFPCDRHLCSLKWSARSDSGGHFSFDKWASSANILVTTNERQLYLEVVFVLDVMASNQPAELHAES